MAHRKMNIRCDSVHPVMMIERNSAWNHKLVYVLRADRRVRRYNGGKNNESRTYEKGGSRIIYIGETSVGKAKMVRPAYSAVRKGERAFNEISGVRRIEIHLVTAKRRQGVQKIWEKLERGLLAVFVEEYGKPPCYNKQGKKFKVSDVTAYFTRSRLKAIIDDLS
jgi:hypothetical protein